MPYKWTEVWDPQAWMDRYTRETHPEKYRRALQEKIQSIKVNGACNEARLGEFEKRIKQILCAEGVSREHMPFYHAYALEVWARAREKEWTVDRVNEWRMIRMKWESRGLVSQILDKIDTVIPLGRGR